MSTSNVIYAGSGNDQIFAIGAGTNTVYAGSGTDLLVGGSGANTLVAGTGADTFNGTFGPTTVSFADAAASVTVNLLDPALNTGIAANDTFIGIHRLIGSNHGDTLTADNAGDILIGGSGNNTLIGGTGKDTLIGGAGNDVLYGGGGGDTLTGGRGANRFVFEKLSDSTVATKGRATITDFSSAQGDQIDLSALAAALHETLTFIGTAAFSHVAGQVRYGPTGKDTLVTLGSTGNGTADFAVLLKHSLNLTSADFILGGGASSASLAPSGAVLGQAISTFTSGADGGAHAPWTPEKSHWGERNWSAQ